ncbi:unnamed protein product [Lota lota]
MRCFAVSRGSGCCCQWDWVEEEHHWESPRRPQLPQDQSLREEGSVLSLHVDIGLGSQHIGHLFPSTDGFSSEQDVGLPCQLRSFPTTPVTSSRVGSDLPRGSAPASCKEGTQEFLKVLKSPSTIPTISPANQEPNRDSKAMSSSIKRRHSNKQGLQNLIRVTAQRSQEDAEELERERRRRSREQPREQWEHGDQGGRPTWGPRLANPNPPQESSLTPPTAQYDEEVKPPQSRLVLEEDEGFSDWSQRLENRKESLLRQEHSRRSEESHFTHKQKLKHPEEEDKKGEGLECRESVTTPGTSRYSEEKFLLSASQRRTGPCHRRFSLRSSGLTATCCIGLYPVCSKPHFPSSPTQRDLDLVDGEGAGAFQSLDEAYQTHRDRGEWVVGELKRRKEEQPHDVADFHYSLDERCRLQDVEVKHSPPQQENTTAVSKIDDYIHDIKSDAKTAKPLATDLPNPSEPVSVKKNLFEAGDAWIQNSVKVTLSKDAEGLKVGVADLINQWVKGSPDGTRSSSPTKPVEIKPGDVLCKKNLWENLGDSPSPGRGGKGSSPGKRYKFVVAGHGKYEKVAVDDNDCSQHDNYQSAGDYHEDL